MGLTIQVDIVLPKTHISPLQSFPGAQSISILHEGLLSIVGVLVPDISVVPDRGLSVLPFSSKTVLKKKSYSHSSKILISSKFLF